jgi:cell wall-associated NlpC family hydrolase
MSDFSDKLVWVATQKIGEPYIWAGRGDFYVSGGQIKPIRAAGCLEGFDCAGLVDFAAWKAGAGDLRYWWGANHFWHLLPEPGPSEKVRLRLYGTPDYAWHVALDLGDGRMLQAAGGDHTTVTAELARVRNACVRIDPVRRSQFLGFRSVDALQMAPRIPPPITKG